MQWLPGVIVFNCVYMSIAECVVINAAAEKQSQVYLLVLMQEEGSESDENLGKGLCHILA